MNVPVVNVVYSFFINEAALTWNAVVDVDVVDLDVLAILILILLVLLWLTLCSSSKWDLMLELVIMMI